jgi:sensor histidine kinase regulating citrate/malate metabolism
LATAIEELIVNGIEAPRPPGREPWVEVAAEDRPDKIRIHVNDNGQGITGKSAGSDMLNIQSTKARPPEGLPNVLAAVQLIKGSVMIDNTGPEGTSILVELPRRGRGSGRRAT